MCDLTCLVHSGSGSFFLAKLCATRRCFSGTNSPLSGDTYSRPIARYFSNSSPGVMATGSGFASSDDMATGGAPARAGGDEASAGVVCDQPLVQQRRGRRRRPAEHSGNASRQERSPGAGESYRWPSIGRWLVCGVCPAGRRLLFSRHHTRRPLERRRSSNGPAHAGSESARRKDDTRVPVSLGLVASVCRVAGGSPRVSRSADGRGQKRRLRLHRHQAERERPATDRRTHTDDAPDEGTTPHTPIDFGQCHSERERWTNQQRPVIVDRQSLRIVLRLG